MLKAVISLARLWVGVESTKSLFLAKAKANIFSADVLFFFPVSQPMTFFKTSFEPYMENLIGSYHEEHSMKPSQVQPATKKPKGIATSALEQNEGPGRGRGAGEEGSHLRCRRRKEGQRKLSLQTD